MRLGVAVVLVLAGAEGRVLGAGEGGTEGLTVFVGLVAAVVVADAEVEAAVELEEMDLAEPPEEETSFACPSFAS